MLKEFEIIVKRLPVEDFSAEYGFISRPRIQLEELTNLDTIMTRHAEQLQSVVVPVQKVDMNENITESDDCEIIVSDETIIVLDGETFVTSTANLSTELKRAELEHEIYDKEFFDIFINHHLNTTGSAKKKVCDSSKVEKIGTGHAEQLHSVFIYKENSEIKDTISEDCDIIDINTSKSDLKGKQSVTIDLFAVSKQPAGLHSEDGIVNNATISEKSNRSQSRIECIYFFERTKKCFGKHIPTEHTNGFLHECDIGDEPVITITTKLARTLKDFMSVNRATEGNNNSKHACQRCKNNNQPECILLCEICDHGYHCSCLKPELLTIPEGDWICPNCQKQKLIKTLRRFLHNYDNACLDKIRRQSLIHRSRTYYPPVVVVEDSESPSSDVQEIFTPT